MYFYKDHRELMKKILATLRPFLLTLRTLIYSMGSENKGYPSKVRNDIHKENLLYLIRALVLACMINYVQLTLPGHTSRNKTPWYIAISFPLILT